MAKKKPQAPVSVLDIPCKFGGVSYGDQTARVGVTFTRDACNIIAADEIFCGHRLSGRIVLGGSDEMHNQKKFIESNYEVDATFDVKQMGVNSDHISIGLTFNKKEVKGHNLEEFAKGSGRLIVQTVADIPDDAPDDEEENDGASLPGSLTADGPWRDVQLDTLFNGAILKSLKAAGLSTVGDMANYSKDGKELDLIDGIGAAAKQKIEDRLLEFHRDNPE